MRSDPLREVNGLYFEGGIIMGTLRWRGISTLQLFILGSFFMISSCGGGGGGGGTPYQGGSVSYNGITTQAPITVANANKFFSVIWNGGPSTTSAGSVSLSLATRGTASPGYLKYTGLINEIKGRAASDFASFVARSKNLVLKTEVNETQNGSVSGTLTITGSIDPYTVTGTLYMAYANYNNGDGYTYDGTVTFTVSGFNITYGRITDGTMSFTLWTIKSANGNVSLNGSIKVQESLPNNSDTLTVNMDGLDNVTSDTFRFQNFVIAFYYTNILSPTSETEAFSGRVYVGAYGYVDVSTTARFFYSSYTQACPDSGGPIIMAGAANSKAAVTSISTSYVKIEVDADGDAAFESQNFYDWNNLGGTAVSITGALTQDATNITDTSATLNGTFTNPAGYTTTVWFEYGPVLPYGFTTVQQTYGAAGPIPVSANITGLLGMTQYHFRLVSQNSMGTFYGDDKTFMTYITPQVIASGLNGPSDLVVDAANVYWTGWYDGTVSKTGISGGPATILASEGSYNYASGIAIDASNVYWTEYGSGKIQSVPIGGGTVTTIASGLDGPGILKLQSGSLYCIESGAIIKVDIASGVTTTLAAGSTSYSIAGDIAMDATNLYWTDIYGGTIKKVGINGGSVITLATGLYQPGPIAVDSSSVYWSEGSGGIKKTSINGGAVTIIAGASSAGDLAVDSGYVYWSENNSGDSSWSVRKVRISGGEITTLGHGQFNSYSSSIKALAIDSSSIYWIVSGDINFYPPPGYINKIPKSY